MGPHGAENLLCTDETLQTGEAAFALAGTFDDLRCEATVCVAFNGTLHTPKICLYDSADLASGYGMNIVLERIVYADGTTRTCEYFWGLDRSGTEQGAGGVGGLLAVSIDGAFYFPLYGDNSNIVGYVSETGTLAAQYVYDPYGNVVETYGSQADLFAFGFSTKYHDRETDLVAYQRRFYSPTLGRWLNRDPIEEAGSINLFCYGLNSPVYEVDRFGLQDVVYETRLSNDVSILG